MKNVLIILLFCLGFSLDKDWQVFGNHEISINSVIIEFKDEYEDKDEAKSYGAKWDPSKKKWYYMSNLNIDKIELLQKFSK